MFPIPRRFKSGFVSRAAGAVFATGGMANAQGDLYYMHNASAYYIWSDRNSCELDLQYSNNDCLTFGGKPLCGSQLYSTAATLGVAIDKVKRNDTIIIRHTNGNSEFCRITP